MRRSPLKRTTPLVARTPLRRGAPLKQGTALSAGAPLSRTTPIPPVSARRAAENTVRRAIIASLFPEGTLCAVPGCGRLYDDVHEPLTRGRGGSITDPENMVPLCRPHHNQVTFAPESTLGWAYDLGLLVHSWDKSRPKEIR